MRKSENPDVEAAKQSVRPLVDRTVAEIAHLARVGIAGLEAIRVPERNEIAEINVSTLSSYDRKKVSWARRFVPIPAGALTELAGLENVRITRATTQLHHKKVRRTRLNNYGPPPQRYSDVKPIKGSKQVVIDVSAPPTQSPVGWLRWEGVTLGISESGYAEIYGRTDETYPRSPYKAGVYDFEDPELLLGTYAEKYANALAVAGLVSHGLERAYGIRQGLSVAESLFNRWQNGGDLSTESGDLSARELNEIETSTPFWARSDLAFVSWNLEHQRQKDVHGVLAQ